MSSLFGMTPNFPRIPRPLFSSTYSPYYGRSTKRSCLTFNSHIICLSEAVPSSPAEFLCFEESSSVAPGPLLLLLFMSCKEGPCAPVSFNEGSMQRRTNDFRCPRHSSLGRKALRGKEWSRQGNVSLRAGGACFGLYVNTPPTSRNRRQVVCRLSALLLLRAPPW